MMLGKIFNPNPFTGWHMLGVVFLFFGVIIAVNLTLAYNASQTWTGLVVKNTYVASQKFNKRIAGKEQQAALGWKVALMQSDNAVKLTITDKQGQPLTGAQVDGKIGRPTHEGEDRDVSFVESSAGTYKLNDPLKSGRWDLHLDVKHQGGHSSEIIRFDVKARS